MARYYYYLTNYHHRHRHLKRLKRLIVGFIVLIIAAAALVTADIIHSHAHQTTPLSQQSTVIQQASITVIRSQYFQFQAPTGWEEIAGSGVNGKYIYRNNNNGLIDQELEIYVNVTQSIPLTAEYVLPVQIWPNGRLTSGEVSDHCKTGAPKGISETSLPIVFQSIHFNCHVDGTDYTVLIGVKGGTPQLTLTRSNGSTAQYTIVYHDLTANPGPGQLTKIIGSFQAR